MLRGPAKIRRFQTQIEVRNFSSLLFLPSLTSLQEIAAKRLVGVTESGSGRFISQPRVALHPHSVVLTLQPILTADNTNES